MTAEMIMTIHSNLFLSKNKLLVWQMRNRLREFLIAASQQVAQE